MISVCMATYNGERFIKEQVVSILNQLSSNDELIISDDGSTDNTLAIIKTLNDNRIHLKQNIKSNNRKHSRHFLVTKNFENALSYAKGDIIFLADQDDIWKTNKVETCLHYLKTYDILFTNYDIIDNEGKVSELQFLKENPIDISFYKMMKKMPFHGCCMCFKKEVLKQALPFPKKLLLHDNWIGILWAYQHPEKIKFIKESFVLYRQHTNNVSGVSRNSWMYKLLYRAEFLFDIYKRLIFKI